MSCRRSVSCTTAGWTNRKRLFGITSSRSKIKRRLGNKRGMAASLGEIAIVLERLGQARQAEAKVREALAIHREIGNRAGIATSLLNLGSLLNETLGRPNDALPLFQEALRLRRESGNATDEALVLNNIGTAYLSMGQHLDAQTQLERALDIREKNKVAPDDLADTLHNLGETMIMAGRFDTALERFHRALESPLVRQCSLGGRGIGGNRAGVCPSGPGGRCGPIRIGGIGRVSEGR